MNAAFHQAISLLKQAHDALDIGDTDIDFEDEDEEAEYAPTQYAGRKVMEAIDLLHGIAAHLPAAQQAQRDALYAKRWWWAVVSSPEWTYAVCKWDGADWLPIRDDEDLRELDAAMSAGKEQK